MTSIAQMLHVARKDARLARWSLLLYAIVIALITANALFALTMWGTPLWIMLLCVIGAVLTGMFVHADSPARVDAFWATRPLVPGAVYAAKLIGIALLIALPVIGELLALRAHDASIARASTLLIRPAAAYLTVLAVAVMIAVLTPNLRVFASVFLAVFAFMLIGAPLVPWTVSAADVRHIPLPLMFLAATGGMFALGWQQYRTRRVRSGFAAGALLMILAMLIPVKMLARQSSGLPEMTSITDSTSLRVQIEAPQPGGLEQALSVHISAVGSQAADRQYGIYVHEIFVVAGEHRSRLEVEPGTYISERRQNDGYRALNGAPSAHLWLRLSPDQRALLDVPGAKLSVHARMIVRSSRMLLELPVAAGSQVAADGHRVRTLGIDRTAGLALEVRHSTIPVVPDPMPGRTSLAFELVNPVRREAITLSAAHESSTTGALVLPASHAHSRTLTLSPEYGPPYSWRSVNPDDAWLRDARLRLVQRAPVGDYAVQAEAVVRRADQKQ